MQRIMTWRNLIISIIVLLVLYFFGVPFFWPDPTMEIRIPTHQSLTHDPEIEILVSSLHSNFHLTQAYLVFDCPQYEELALPAAAYPVSLHQAAPPQWASPGINRFTFPRQQRYRFSVPIRALAEQGVVRAGPLQAQLHATLSFPHVRPKSRQLPGGQYLVEQQSMSTPITWTLRE